MSSLLVPVSVAAKIIKTKTPVPSLGGQPFNTDALLEPGIHVHWALPDALTRAKTLGGGTDQQSVIFPGVPDYWLVTRFNPPPAAGAPSSARTWRAWVVDSRANKATPAENWNPPAAPDPNTVHTLAGVLPSAKSVKYPGWGIWNGAQTDFDAVITSAIYYPSARTRFGFYDDLAGLPASGNVTYTVIGWYSSTANDPLYNAANREKQIADWLLEYDHHRKLSEIVATIAPNLAEASWKPQMTIMPQAADSSAQVMARLSVTLEQTAQRTASMQVIQASLGTATVSANPGLIFYNPNPTEIVCHGSVMDVPLGAAPTAATALTADHISIYPSVKRALAAATASSVDPATVDYAEMLLQDLDHQKGTMAGVIDLPAAVQALTFQGVPGTGTYFAQIVISPAPARVAADHFELASANEGIQLSGHWPTLARENALELSIAEKLTVSTGSTTTGPAVSTLGTPAVAKEDIGPWLKKVRDAFNAAVSAAQKAGTPIDGSKVKVSDKRAHAQPLRLSPSIDGSSTNSGGWWIDIGNDDELIQILQSTTGTKADVQLPDATNLYNQPGPRWYRPWAPQIVLNDVGRSYRFGEDGRFDPENGRLLCRRSGYTMAALYSSTGNPVSGSQLLANQAGISALKGVPGETLSLLNEAVLLDTGSAPSMAAVSATGPARAAAEAYFTAAIQGLYLFRLPALSVQQLEALGKIQIKGDPPGPVAISPWLKDPWDPLFLDSTYTYAYTNLNSDWKLEEDHVEMTAANAQADNPPANQAETFSDRSRVTAAITKVLESALVTRRSIDPRGNLVVRQAAPNNLTQETFQTRETISAPLVHTLLTPAPGSPYGAFDDALMARGYRTRAGALRVNKVSLVDVFGGTKQWTGPANGVLPSTPLSPRLPYWARLRFRLQSAADPKQEADSQHSPIAGILLPDFLDHSLQVFDGSGNAIGQLTCDRARYGGGPNSPALTLQVYFNAYPWVLAARSVTTTDTTAILNAVIDDVTLRKFVAGVVQQSLAVPAGSGSDKWLETGLTAMLRTIDSVRATLNPAAKTADHKVSLLGEPILVMTGLVEFQTNNATVTAAVAQGAPLTSPPAVPALTVRIGDITRPDDGVLGFFDPGDSPANSHFAPVSKDAADKALLTGLSGLFGASSAASVPVQHAFVKNQTNAVTVQADTPQSVIMLIDIRGSLYATCGVLPRKKVIVPKDFLDASLQNMEPVFAVGPVLSIPGTTPADLKALMPPPLVMGYDADFVSSGAAAGNPPPEIPLPPTAPLADLPVNRMQLTEGWVLMRRHKSA